MTTAQIGKQTFQKEAFTTILIENTMLCSPVKFNWESSACCLLYAGSLLALLFDPEDGADIFLRNTG
jgi:hypothetical protein